MTWLMRPQLNGAVGGDPELAVGAIDDGKRSYIKVKQIVGSGQVRLQQGENLSQQGRGFLASDRIARIVSRALPDIH